MAPVSVGFAEKSCKSIQIFQIILHLNSCSICADLLDFCAQGTPFPRHLYRVVCADARAVRPYMPLACKSFFNRTNHKAQSSKFNVQRDIHLVHPSTRQLSTGLIINGLYLTFQFQPFCAPISPILPCNMGHISA